MSTLREAAQQALEALVTPDGSGCDEWRRDVITALRDALAQEDEMREMLRTLGFGSQCPESIGITLRRWRDGYAAALAQEEPTVRIKCTVVDNQHPSGIPFEQWVNTPRREWQGLTENELGELMRDSCGYPMCPNGDDLAFARAVERALKEKNHG